MLTVTNPKNETTTYAYDRDDDNDGVTDGYLVSVTGPISSATTALTYDSAKRVQTATDSDNYTLTYSYDNVDRVTSIGFPDGTTKQFAYTKFVNGADTGVMFLDLGASKDRRNRWSFREYNANRQLVKATDPLGRNTLFDWCRCGSLGSITDGNNHITSFIRDVQGRVTSKTFADSTSWTYAYEGATSRLKSLTDPKNQRTNYSYFADNNVNQVSYTNTSGQALWPATPTISFTYDPNYNRVATMVDGTGTTTYAYNPITGNLSVGAGRLQSVDGPLANDTITYTHDELGRELSHAVNNVAASETYDDLGRVDTVSNPLGSFTNTYVAASRRLQTVSYPNGQSTSFSYYGNTKDNLLQTIQHLGPGSTLISKLDYDYDAEAQITSFTRQVGAAGFPVQWTNSINPMHDDADQLREVFEQNSPDTYSEFSYGYDDAGNRTTDNAGTHSFNSVNQITAAGYVYDGNGNLAADPWRTYEWDAANRLVAINYTALGTRSEFSYDGLGRRVKIVETNAGTSFVIQPPDAQYSLYTSSFAAAAGTYVLKLEGVNPNGGDNTVFVDAVSLNGALVPNGGFETPNLGGGSFGYNPAGAGWAFSGYAGISNNGSGFTSSNPAAPEGSQVGIVQMNGSMSQSVTLTGGSYTLSLKAAQRVSWQSSYQQVRVSLLAGALIASTKQFVWNGDKVAEERDANNSVTRRFYPQGEQISGTSYYYTRDHLGSVREMTDGTGAVRASYYYDPYGNRSKQSGDLEASFGFTGHYYHQPSGLELTRYRGYDGITGRWLSRDPIGLAGGSNLYVYAANDTLNARDPLGLDVWYENTIAVDGWHRRIAYTDRTLPRGWSGQSFGLADGRTSDGSSAASGEHPAAGESGSGVVYPDVRDPATNVVERFVTTPEEDELIKRLLQNELGNTGPYNPLTNSCRDYSKNAFKRMKRIIEDCRRQKGHK